MHSTSAITLKAIIADYLSLIGETLEQTPTEETRVTLPPNFFDTLNAKLDDYNELRKIMTDKILASGIKVDKDLPVEVSLDSQGISVSEAYEAIRAAEAIDLDTRLAALTDDHRRELEILHSYKRDGCV